MLKTSTVLSAALLILPTSMLTLQEDCSEPPPDCSDFDGDGYGDGVDCLGLDCDDLNPAVYDGAVENCEDGLDNNCDGLVDDLDSECAPADSDFELYANFHTIGINIELMDGGDPEGDLVTSVIYQALPDGSVRSGFPLAAVHGFDRLSGALFGLDPDTSYSVTVSLTDASTPDLNAVYSGEVRTRAEPVSHQPSHTYVVSPDGDGATCSLAEPCSLPEAMGQVRAGESIDMLGGVYHIGGLTLAQSGTAEAPITIRSAPGETAVWDGSDPAPRTWSAVAGYEGVYVSALTEKNANTNCVVADGVRLYPYRNLGDLYSQTISCILATPQAAGLDGFWRDPRPSTTVPLATTNPYYKKLYVKFSDNTSPDTRDIKVSNENFALNISGQAYIHFRDLTFRYYGVSPVANAIVATDTSFTVFDGCDFEHNDRSIAISGASHQNVVQNSRFLDNTDWNTYIGKATYEPYNPQLCYQTTPNPYPWLDRMLETGGVVYGHGFGGRGTIIRNNHFQGLMDGFKGVPPSVVEGYVSTEMDIYNNTVLHADDAMEVDGVSANVRVWGNTLTDVGSGVSVAPPARGPVYIIGNVMHGLRETLATIEGNADLVPFNGAPFKLDCPCEGGDIYFMHNTSFTIGDGHGMRIYSPTKVQRFFARNNVMVADTNFALNVITSDLQTVCQLRDAGGGDRSLRLRGQRCGGRPTVYRFS